MNRDTLGYSLCDVWLARLCSRNSPLTPSRLEWRHHEAPVVTPDIDLLIPPTTKVLDAQTQKSLNTNDKTGVLKFSSDATVTFEPGQVLVSTSTPVAPQGFLRRIKTVRCEGHQIILETEQAKIFDAIHVTHVSRPVLNVSSG
jgi:hypothetical protein